MATSSRRPKTSGLPDFRTSGPEIPWYSPGLNFSCTRCGNCCTGAPGFTWLTEAEADAMAGYLGLDGEAFRQRYTRRVWRNGHEYLSLIDKPNHDCVFFQRGQGCTVYPHRPKQCRTWPFWRRNLVSAEAWAEAAAECPGMNRGSRHAAAQIERIAADDGLVR